MSHSASSTSGVSAKASASAIIRLVVMGGVVMGGLSLTSVAALCAENLKPYEPIIATYDQANLAQPELADLVKKLIAAAEGKDLKTIEAHLSKNYAIYYCPSHALAGCGPGVNKPASSKGSPLERMRLAFCCRGAPASGMSPADQNETLFAMLSAIFQSGVLGKNPDHPGAVCTPAPPVFDRRKAADVAKANGVDRENLLVAGKPMELRRKPALDAPIVHTLKVGEIAFVVNNLTAEIPPGWTAFSTPQGGVAFSNQGGLEELAPTMLCFTRENGKDWSIAYSLQRGG